MAEMPFALLQAYDLMRQLPSELINCKLLLQIWQVINRFLFMHILPVIQALTLGVLTIYWLLHNREVPWCPDRIWIWRSNTILCGLAGAWVLVWPMVIPYFLIVLANYRMIKISFMRPPTPLKQDPSVWHSSNGGDPPPCCGSNLITLLLLLTFDAVVAMLPLAGIYLGPNELLASWFAITRGNRFTYVTASKAVGTGANYGATADSDATTVPHSDSEGA